MRHFLSLLALSSALATTALAQPVAFAYSDDSRGAPQLLLNGALTSDAKEYGWWNFDAGVYGHNNSGTQTNYLAGIDSEGATFRNYFVFNVPDVVVNTAVLRLNAFFVFGNPLFTLYDFAGNIPSLIGYPAVKDNQGIFNDLGDGVQYGSRLFLDTEDELTVDVVLNADAIAQLNAVAGTQIAMGGRMDADVIGAPSTVVPEPASIALVASGMLVIACVTARRRTV